MCCLVYVAGKYCGTAETLPVPIKRLHLAKLLSFDAKYQFLFALSECLSSLKLSCFPLRPFRHTKSLGDSGTEV